MFQLYLQANDPTDQAPATCYDFCWDLTLRNISSVLSDVAIKHTEWGLTEPKPVILRYKNDIESELVQYVFNRIQQITRQLKLTDKILVPEIVSKMPQGAKEELLKTQQALKAQFVPRGMPVNAKPVASVVQAAEAVPVAKPVAAPQLGNLQQPQLPGWKTAEEGVPESPQG